MAQGRGRHSDPGTDPVRRGRPDRRHVRRDEKARHQVQGRRHIGEVESVKTTSDIYCAVAGEVTEVNAALSDDPGLLNKDPYGKGWLAKIKIADKSGLATLMDSKTYDSKN